MISMFVPAIEDVRPSILENPSNDPSRLCGVITREKWSDYFVLHFADGSTEELEPDETRQWFLDRGADKRKLDSFLDTVWNFGKAEFEVEHTKEPVQVKGPAMPNV